TRCSSFSHPERPVRDGNDLACLFFAALATSTLTGMLIQHKKEHVIHGGMTRDDVLFQYTTTGWMMWNWMVSALSVGATIVLYDGSPFMPNPGALWDLIDRHNHSKTLVTALVSLHEIRLTSNETPKVYTSPNCATCKFTEDHHSLTSLHSVYSTGSPLKPESFDYVYEKVAPKALLGSITGGTDICSLFAGHNTSLPVYRGEIQCLCLGMKVESWSHEGKAVFGRSGDLVCTKPFPAMPLYFFGDNDGRKYRDAYFAAYDGTTVCAPPLVAFPGVLTRALETFTAVEDSLAVGQIIPGMMDERVVLFLKCRGGRAAFTPELVDDVKKRIRTQLSPRHVPAVVLPIDEIPVMFSSSAARSRAGVNAAPGIFFSVRK
ncbi:MAG: acetoacetyl-CoA synthetase, isoform CRA_b, partial [Olpidium bornovanus]